MNYIWDDIMNEDEVESSLFQFNGSTFTEALIENYLPNSQQNDANSSSYVENDNFQEGTFLNYALGSSGAHSQSFFNYPQVTSTPQYQQVPSSPYPNNNHANNNLTTSINPKALQYNPNSPPPSPFFFSEQENNTNNNNNNYFSSSSSQFQSSFNNSNNNNNNNNNANNNQYNNFNFFQNTQKNVKIQPKQEEFSLSNQFFGTNNNNNNNNIHYMSPNYSTYQMQTSPKSQFNYNNNDINNQSPRNNYNNNNIISPRLNSPNNNNINNINNINNNLNNMNLSNNNNNINILPSPNNKKNKNDNNNLSLFQPNVKIQKTSPVYEPQSLNNNNYVNDKFNLNNNNNTMQFQLISPPQPNNLCQFNNNNNNNNNINNNNTTNQLEIKVEEHPPVEVRTRTPGENRTFSLKGVVMGNYKGVGVTSVSVMLEYALASRDTKDDRPKQTILGGTKVVVIGNEGVFRFENLCMTEASTKHTEKEFCLHFCYVLSSGKEISSHFYTSPFYAYSHKKVLNRRKNISLRATSKQFGPISGGGEIHLVGTPFIKGPSLKILFKTPNGNVEIKYSDGEVERYSETVLFFALPPYPQTVNILRDEIPVEILVTNDGRNYSNPLFFTYFAK